MAKSDWVDPQSKLVKKIKEPEPLESKIQEDIMKMLTDKDWYCIKTHGNLHQHGLPDIFACHDRYGIRWIEVKRKKGYSFTSAQRKVFHRFAEKKVGVWILTEATESEYEKLFKSPNWYRYLPEVAD